MTPELQKGFTLIELLTAVAIYSLLVLALSALFALLLGAQAKHHAVAEVEAVGVHAVSVLTQAIRQAASVTSPSSGATDNALTLEAYDAGVDPTVFDVVFGVLQITQGSGSAVALTPSSLSVSNFQVENLTRSGTAGNVRVSFTLSRINPDGQQAFSYERTFYGTASLRQPE